VLTAAQLDEIKRALAPTIIRLASEIGRDSKKVRPESGQHAGPDLPGPSTEASIAEARSRNLHPSGRMVPLDVVAVTA
jgi:hypothetical protein